MKMMVIVVMIIMMMVISDHLPIVRNCADNIFPEGGNKKPRSLFPPTCDKNIHCEEIIIVIIGLTETMIIAMTCDKIRL